MDNKNISICLATYNGEKYIEKQLISIIENLENKDDEIIIIDDKSTDKTLDIIKKIKVFDNRIKIFQNKENIGVNKSFEICINKSKNEYIFLADQDDIWPKNRLKNMISELEKTKKKIIAGNQIFIDKNDKKINYNTLKLKEKDSNRKLKNIYKIFNGTAYYTGCAMGFKREIKNKILPFPSYIESHDLWIAKVGIINNTICHFEKNVLKRRIHGENASIIKRNLRKKIKSRIIFIISILEILKRNYLTNWRK